MDRKFVLLISYFLLSLLVKGQTLEKKIADFDTYIAKARQQWQVPGLAVAVVKDGKMIFAKGYGQRKLGNKAEVTPQTLYCIGSTTKAITAAAMGMLVDEGKVDWDDVVTEILPEFQLYDPYVTRALRIRDLFTHNAGLGNADFLWAYNDLTPDEILYQMRFAKPAYPFRGGYTYQNIMYLAAGKVIEKLSGTSWETFVKERIFNPLGMSRSVPLLKDALQQENISTPHHFVKGKITPIEDTSADAIAPAGAIWSSVEDMSKWMTFMLDSARVDNKRLISKETFAELLTPQVLVPSGSFYPTIALTKPHWTTYALGWFQHDYDGRFVSFHTGSLGGTIAIIGLMPDEKIGVYVLGNLDHAEVRHALMYKAFDTFGHKSSGRDWSSEMYDLYQRIRAEAEADQKRILDRKVPGTSPSLAIEEYTGSYFDRYYGKASIEYDNSVLVLKLSSKMKATLKHWHYDTFLGQFEMDWWPPALVKFEIGPFGKVESVQMGSRIFRKNK